MRIGVLGGTFDPVHIGHLIIAEEACVKLKLDTVIFVPAGNPWFKGELEVTPSEYRLEMLRRAIKSNPNFCIDTQELDRDGPSYTVETMGQIKRKMDNTDLYFIIGLDALMELARWKEPGKLGTLCRFAAMRRPFYLDLDVASLTQQVPEVAGRIEVVDNVLVDISSSQIRERIRKRESIRYLVPDNVLAYIEEKGLYRDR